MGTIFFWATFFIVSGWVLKRWYFPSDTALVKRLRIVAVLIEVATACTFFFPWLPLSRGGSFGWELVIQGKNMGMVFLATLLVVALVAFLGFQRSMFLKAGAVAHSIATVTLFVVMTQIMPGTVALTF